MEPDQNQEPIQPLELPASDVPVELPALPLKRVLIGGTFLALSIGSGMALVIAYLPSLSSGTSQAQIASAEITQQSDAYASLELTGKGIYVFDASDDTELFKRNPDAQLPLASITKVVLTLVVSEVVSMDSTVTISREAVKKGGGGLTRGEVWRVRDLIDYMLIASSNTAAEALKEAAEPSLREKHPEAPVGGAVIWRMNALASELGMDATYFINPSGLDESLTQAGALGSARDIATLFAYALRTNRELFAGTSREYATLGPINMPKRDVHNTNDALSTIPHIYMGKTGLTDLAGGNLAIAFDAGENHPVIIVVLGSTPEGRFTDMERLVGTTTALLLDQDTPE